MVLRTNKVRRTTLNVTIILLLLPFLFFYHKVVQRSFECETYVIIFGNFLRLFISNIIYVIQRLTENVTDVQHLRGAYPRGLICYEDVCIHDGVEV